MAITGLVIIEKENTIKTMIKSNVNELWNGSINLNTNSALKRLVNFPGELHDTIINLSNEGKLKMRKVSAFMANGKFVYIKDLYPDKVGEIGYYVCFYIDKGKSSLVSMDARRVQEVRAVGYDSYKHCRIPLTIIRETIGGKRKFISANLY